MIYKAVSAGKSDDWPFWYVMDCVKNLNILGKYFPGEFPFMTRKCAENFAKELNHE